VSAATRPLDLHRYIDIATDRYADDASRDDAIDALAWVDDESALAALVLIARGSTGQDEMLLATAGESVATTWLRRGWYDAEVAGSFDETSRRALDRLIAAECRDVGLPQAASDAAPHPAWQGPLTPFE
jgi:hypothetical protein